MPTKAGSGVLLVHELRSLNAELITWRERNCVHSLTHSPRLMETDPPVNNVEVGLRLV